MTDSEIYKYHGWREQCKQITSEMYELTEAIHDYENCNSQATLLKDWNHISEEIADLYFMLNQIKEYYLIEDENIKAWLEYKHKREVKRIEEGYYNKEK